MRRVSPPLPENPVLGPKPDAARRGQGLARAPTKGGAREGAGGAAAGEDSGVPWWRYGIRGVLGAAAFVVLVWLVSRGPLVAPISLYADYGASSGFYSASHMIPALAVVGALACLWAAVDRGAAWPRPAALAVIALPLAGLTLAALHAVYAHDAWMDLEIFVCFAVFWCGLVVLVGADGGGLWALAALAGLGDWQAVVGLGQWQSGQPTPVGWTGVFASAIPVRISGTLHNPNVLASVLLVALGAAAALALVAPWRALRLTALAAILPVAVALPLSFSRAAYLGVVALVLAAALLLPRGLRIRGLGVFAAVAAPLLAVALAVPGVLFRVHTISVQGGGDVASRFFSWRDALAIWRARPILGAGPGGLEALYARYHPVSARGTYVLIDVPGSPDSDPLQWLAETGLVGVVALASAVALAVTTALRTHRRRPALAAAAAPLIGTALALAVQGVFEVTAYCLPIAALGAVLLAALAGLGGQVRRTGRRPLRPLAWATAATGGAVALLLAASWGPQVHFAAAWAHMEAGHPGAALSQLRLAVREDPGSERNVAALGDAEVRVAYTELQNNNPKTGQTEALARKALARALQFDPFDASVWADSGVLLEIAGEARAAACAQQAAVQDTPDAPYQAYQLAVLLRQAGQAKAAAADAAYAARLFPLQLAVYREYGDQNQPYYQIARANENAGLNGWTGPLPQAPTYPLPAAACRAALALAGLPAGQYGRAFAGASA